jgi:AraC family transcriptional regulator
MRRRVEFAKVLMLATKTSLGRIAADCGFADQPHFNRHFRRLVGENPNAWRRARARTLHTKID